jgi:hypothetical protein
MMFMGHAVDGKPNVGVKRFIGPNSKLCQD